MRKLITTAVSAVFAAAAFAQTATPVATKQQAEKLITTCNNVLAVLNFSDVKKPVKNGVYKVNEKKATDGITQTYIDVKGNSRDTIYVFIPFEIKKEEISKAVATANK